MRARNDRMKILKFWSLHNKSNSYSKKLNLLFQTYTKIISQRPFIGKRTNLDDIRVQIIRDYLMIYKVADTKIYILTIWDARQNPEKLEFK